MNPEKITLSTERIRVKLTMPGIAITQLAGSSIVSNLFKNLIGKALDEKGLVGQMEQTVLVKDAIQDGAGKLHTSFICAFDNQAFGIFGVTDRMEGLTTIRATLEGVGLLRYSDIFWWHSAESVYRAWYPEGSMARWEDDNATFAQWNDILFRWAEAEVARIEKQIGQ